MTASTFFGFNNEPQKLEEWRALDRPLNTTNTFIAGSSGTLRVLRRFPWDTYS